MNISEIFIAGDHASLELKKTCKEFLESLGYKVTDLGAYSKESVDYPDFAYLLTKKLKENLNSFGVLICGTGIGISIAANRDKFIRCALCHDEFTAKMAREHNDANVLCFGARTTDENLAKKMCELFFKTEFEGGRHERRVKKLS